MPRRAQWPAGAAGEDQCGEGRRHAGKARVDARLGERVSFEVRDALFEEGLDISDRAVLDRLSAAAEAFSGGPGWK